MRVANILIAEDERPIARSIRTQLTGHGYNISAMVSSGTEAIKKAESLRPDLVLMDIHLQGEMTGIEAGHYISKVLLIPIIYLTGYSDEKTISQAMITEPYAYMTKPFNGRDLYTNIEIALHKNKIERTLRMNERCFFNTLNSLTDAIISIDLEGYIRYINPTAEKLMNFPPKKCLNRKPSEIFTVWDNRKSKAVPELLKHVLSTGKTLFMNDHSLQFRNKKTVIPIQGSLALIKEDQKNIFGFVFIFHDISVRKKLQKALQWCENKYQMLIKTLPVGLFITDKNENIIYVNDIIFEMSGLSRHELLGKPVTSLLEKKQYEMIKKKSSRETGQMPFLELPLQTGDKGRLDTLLFTRSIPDENGHYQGTLGILMDVTHKKQAEKKISQLNRAINESIDGIAMADLNGRLMYINSAFAQMYGYRMKDMIGMEIKDLHPRSSFKEFTQAQEQIRSKGSWRGEMDNIRKDKTFFITYVSATLLYDERKVPNGSLAVIKDITRYKN
ncbi:MAG: PAS domain S-box protein, partial [bacterium]|nr:PAS domain S-box protein [bacterium]